MKTKFLAVITWFFGVMPQLHSQGYIVPNGVNFVGYSPFLNGYEIDVLQSPNPSDYTGFSLGPQGKTPPTSPFTNTFSFSYLLDEGVRVFLVSPNDPISLQPILSQSYNELLYPNSYVFENNSPFYVGLYTGHAPQNGIYDDPLFGWAQLVNYAGVIELLDSALVYQAAGIYAGTQTIIPEPSTIGLCAMGGLLFVRRWRDSAR